MVSKIKTKKALSRPATARDPGLSTRLALIENAMDQMFKSAEGRDTAIGKLSEISYSIKEMLSLQNQRIQQQGDVLLALRNEVKDHDTNDRETVNYILKHVDDSTASIASTISDDTDRRLITIQDNFKQFFDLHKHDLVDVEQRLDKVIQNQKDHNSVMFEEMKKWSLSLTKRIDKLENWRWTAAGAIGVVILVIEILSHFWNFHIP